MRFFRREPLQATQDEPKRLSDLLSPHLIRIEALERAFKNLELEWENAYDKVHKAVQRLNKRQRDLDRAEADPESTTQETPVSDFEQRVRARRRDA